MQKMTNYMYIAALVLGLLPSPIHYMYIHPCMSSPYHFHLGNLTSGKQPNTTQGSKSLCFKGFIHL